jgi:hypothetical protein
MQTETILDNQVAVINNSIDLFRTAPEVLKANQLRTSKAKGIGEAILQQWADAFAISEEDARMAALAEVDTRSNKYLINCNVALEEEKAARASITQMMDAFKKMFTEAEAELDKTKPGTVAQKIQNSRNLYAAEDNKLRERKRQEAARTAAKAKELIEIRTTFEKSYAAAFNNFLLSKKTKLQQMFNSLKLEKFADDAAQIRLVKPQFTHNHFDSLVSDPVRWPQYHTTDEVIAIGLEVKAPLFEGYAATYQSEMNATKEDIVAKIPSKHEELKEQKRLADEAAAEQERQRIAEQRRQEEIAKVNAAEKDRLIEKARIEREQEQARLAKIKEEQEQAAAEQKRREEEEQARLAREAEEARKKAELEAEVKKQGEQTMVLFEQEAAIAGTAPAPETRKGYDIVVTHPVGYTQIFALWFENEGKNQPIDKIGNTKLDQMKAWAEKYALKTGTKIESKFLYYEESIKAVNRKAK